MGEKLSAQSPAAPETAPRARQRYITPIGYAAELRIETDVTGVGYPCLKQLALAVHSKAEAGLKCRICERELSLCRY